MRRNHHNPLTLVFLAFLMLEGVVCPPNLPIGSPQERHQMEDHCNREV
jgi:hypothetical protein